MQLNIITSQQQTQFDYTRSNLSQSATFNAPALLPMPAQQDRIEFSDDARRAFDGEHAVKQMRNIHHGENSSPLFDFIKEILEKIISAQVTELKPAPTAGDSAVLPPQNRFSSITAEQSALSVETSSVSIGGSITTRDGAKISFALDLQMVHASASSSVFNVSSAPGGYDFSFAGSSAELTSTSFNFSLAAELPDGANSSANGLGNFSLKDDLKEVQHALKPYLKAFFKDSGMSSDNYGVKQLLQTVA
jgi:hypothetical protein